MTLHIGNGGFGNNNVMFYYMLIQWKTDSVTEIANSGEQPLSMCILAQSIP